MSRIIFIATFLVCSSNLFATTNLDMQMSATEKAQTGVSTLTPNQKQALAQWIDNHYTLNPTTSQSGLSLSANFRNGQELMLSDDSRWLVNPSDIPISSLWITPFAVQVTPNNDPNYPWTITNLTTNQSIKAKKAPTTAQQ